MEQKRLNLYTVNMKYIRNLHNQGDDRVFSVSPQVGKDNRPFVGIVVICDEKQYCIPLSSPKEKHKTMKNDVDFHPDKFSEEDAAYMMDCLKSMSGKSIWRCFYSANNYKLDLPLKSPGGSVIYWYGSEEKKDRAWDIRYIKKHLPWAELVENEGVGHAEFFTLYPERFVKQIRDSLKLF